jgi:hypothetical protein
MRTAAEEQTFLRVSYSGCRLGGVVRSVLATGPKGRGFKLGQGDGFFFLLFLTTEVFPQPFRLLDHIQLTHTVGLLWTSDQPFAEACTYTGQHNIETQETNIHALSGIRTSDPRNQAAADLRLTSRGYRGRRDGFLRAIKIRSTPSFGW